MKLFYLVWLFLFSIIFFSCKSSIKQTDDNIYSRHLQRHIPLTIITTTMPSKKEEMNLLLFNNIALLETIHAKKIIDSLFSKKLIQPLMLVAYDGKQTDYGLEETENKEQAKQILQYNQFVGDELFTFIKKKSLVRKFNIVAISGFGAAALNAFDVAFNNDDKYNVVGMFSPQFTTANQPDVSTTLNTIQALKKRPTIKLFLEDNGLDSSATKFTSIMDSKKSITECKLLPQSTGEMATSKIVTIRNFATFLLWAFPK